MRHSPHDALPHPFVDTPTMLRRDFLRVAALGTASLTQLGTLFAQDPGEAEEPILHLPRNDVDRSLPEERFERLRSSALFQEAMTDIHLSIPKLESNAGEVRTNAFTKIQRALDALRSEVNPLPADVRSIFVAPYPFADKQGKKSMSLDRWYAFRSMDTKNKMRHLVETERIPSGENLPAMNVLKEIESVTGLRIRPENHAIVLALHDKLLTIEKGRNGWLEVLADCCQKARLTCKFAGDDQTILLTSQTQFSPRLVGEKHLIGLLTAGDNPTIELRTTRAMSILKLSNDPEAGDASVKVKMPSYARTAWDVFPYSYQPNQDFRVKMFGGTEDEDAKIEASSFRGTHPQTVIIPLNAEHDFGTQKVSIVKERWENDWIVKGSSSFPFKTENGEEIPIEYFAPFYELLSRCKYRVTNAAGKAIPFEMMKMRVRRGHAQWALKCGEEPASFSLSTFTEIEDMAPFHLPLRDLLQKE